MDGIINIFHLTSHSGCTSSFSSEILTLFLTKTRLKNLLGFSQIATLKIFSAIPITKKMRASENQLRKGLIVSNVANGQRNVDRLVEDKTLGVSKNFT